MPSLKIHLPGAAPVTHELDHDSIAVGRRDSNTIQIDDPSVSGSHAVLTRRDDGDFTLEDLGSTNGTRLNGKHLERATRLRSGDRVRFGKVECDYASSVAAPEPEPEPEPEFDAGATIAMPAEAAPKAVAPAAAVSRSAKAKPADFVNASPFEKKKATSDPVRTALFGLAALALVGFVVAIVLLLLLEAPKLAI
ncbi:MAG: FHA domain-containing protein [Verrucomicrobia bacterium]|nr:FHA domain-containing protein [Verrucomicrobiota bacterium]